uniref:Putative zinc finger, C2H2 type n=1 Tax=uncultured marine crenarchaeote HF4000_APKG2O16 TaxID=455582 RepID=B3T6X9_9ARCH|nr:putative zinc finger, C2H2 type [uncultured marine crenarchaeote HF4000_APKG2O16]
MGQLINCKICGREFESEEVLKKHQSFCTFSRRKYYKERSR